ncbi:2-dehydro-3-deoxygluconokinase [Allostreptomyces psammosilenae]|uniref:2-dehydro-3-deoxygluconokinase n=2 Tax=Allostreptomyces psammosilenae TaxID=1892865 RepID=A0A853ADK8_9ACTN|nr:2-dehydro-3-deoxygluconokinase [Allostreptomyces psammosilenae]
MAVLTPASRGPLERADTFHRTAGGAESNVARGLVALAVPAAWISAVGDDGFGRHLIGELAEAGVDTSAVLVDPTRPTGLYVKEIGAGDGHPHDLGAGRSRMHYYRGGSAASALGPALLERPRAAALLGGARLVHLTGITAALSDSCLALLHEILRRRGPGQAVSFDLNWREALWRRRDPGVLRPLLDAADLVLLGADEATAVLGTAEPAELRALLPGPRAIVVKNDARDATVLERTAGGEVVTTERALSVDVIEPIGAGDAFAAGYLAGELRGYDARRRLRLGHIAAAATLVVPGDHGAPPPPGVVDALLDCPGDAWERTRVRPDGISSPVLGRLRP